MATLLIGFVGSIALGGLSRIIGRSSSPAPEVQFNQQEGSRLTSYQVTTSTEGQSIARLWGRGRLGGQVIWQTHFREKVTTNTSFGFGSSGGKHPQPIITSVNTTTTYTYYCSFAIGLCEGPVASLGRIWADGVLLDTTKYTVRFYPGNYTQTPDSKIEAVEGTGKTPAYRGLCYVVFEEMDLSAFGNRVPQITVELIKPITTPQATDLEQAVTGYCLIPGSGEFVYGTRVYLRDDGYGNSVPENSHTGQGQADIKASLDSQKALLPNANCVSLVTAWMGDDLRAGNCTIAPRSEYFGAQILWLSLGKKVIPQDWVVSGQGRAGSRTVALDALGRGVYGGTPADITIFEAIQELKARGKTIIFYPFILMEILAGNAKPDPYGGTEQAAFPWRGHVTCHPAPGQPSTVDKTGSATAQISNIVGTCVAANFGAWDGSTIPYSGPAEWTLRRMVLHYAKLCVAAGGVDAFCISSELIGLTKVRDSASNFPFVNALVTLAADVKAIVGSGCKVGYAADWSEYHSYRPTDGTNDVYFNLDPLWSSSNIDFIGIDNYLPVADWRPGSTHLDALAGWTSIKDQNYLQYNMNHGEYFDWYYTSKANRDSQTRTAIVDGAYGKPWVFRNKDFWSWWGNTHKNRPGGVESGSTTSWVAQSKPIWFTEIGCPAIDKGPNEPNVFVDPKSAESAWPYYSTGTRDDAAQRAYIEATYKFWNNVANNPSSGVYSGRMVNTQRIQVWCWDVRNYPEFPARSDVWADTPNYTLGHWLNGRIGIIPLGRLVTELCGIVGIVPNVAALTDSDAVIRGFLIQDLSTVRTMLQTLMTTYMFDGWESEGALKFGLRSNPDNVTMGVDNLVVTNDDAQGYTITRSQETELPKAVQITFIDEDRDYNNASVNGIRQVGGALKTDAIQLPLVLRPEFARGIADVIMQEAWIGRESVELALPPSMIAVDPGDLLAITLSGRSMTIRMQDFGTGYIRSAHAMSHDPSIYTGFLGSSSSSRPSFVPVYGQSLLYFMDIPLITGQEDYPWSPRMVAYQFPWPNAVTVDLQQSDSSFTPIGAVASPSVIGRLTAPLYSGPHGLWDMGNSVYVEMVGNNMTLSSAADSDVLSGANMIAVYNSTTGGWELLQFANATLAGVRTYTLSKLLRAQQGTEDNMGNPVATGAPVVLISSINSYLPLTNDRARLQLTLAYGPAAYNPSHYTWKQTTVTFTSRGLRPLSPSNVAGRRNWTTGDWSVMWLRRTRFNGDSWESPDVPLNEESEKYEVDIMSGSTVKRTFAVTTPAIAYTSAQQVADFGSNQANLDVFVYQISATVGRGIGRRVTLYG